MLDRLEKIAKIVSLVAIPAALWWLGTQYQSADTKAKTAVEYVKLSIAIIGNQNDVDPALLVWASETLNHYSEVKFSKPLAEAIASGEANVSPASAAGGWFAVVGSLSFCHSSTFYRFISFSLLWVIFSPFSVKY